jgi:hypothetical protein
MPADSGRRQPIESGIDALPGACYVTACQRQTTAGILDQRPRYEVGSAHRRLTRFDKLAIAVVDDNLAVRAQHAHSLAECLHFAC